jgi:two-component sensor histidine kinase
MGTRLFDDLESLRDLNERQEVEKAKRALEESGRQKDLLMKEVDHRVKNSLQIVSSLLHLQAKTAGPAASQFHSAAARVAAIAAVHQQLHQYDDVGTVALDRYIVDLCQQITAAFSSPDRAWPLIVDADPLTISTDVAVPLALIVNELITNAIQHSNPQGESKNVHIALKNQADNFSISITDPGNGPSANQPPGSLGLDMPDWVLKLSTRLLARFMQQSQKNVRRPAIRSQLQSPARPGAKASMVPHYGDCYPAAV